MLLPLMLSAAENFGDDGGIIFFLDLVCDTT